MSRPKKKRPAEQDFCGVHGYSLPCPECDDPRQEAWVDAYLERIDEDHE